MSPWTMRACCISLWMSSRFAEVDRAPLRSTRPQENAVGNDPTGVSPLWSNARGGGLGD